MIRKSVFITGASGDIGYAIAKKFASNGYNIIATYNKGNVDMVKSLQDEYKIEVLSLQLDISSYSSIEQAFKQAFTHFDYIDCVVCNAGISKVETLLSDSSKEDIEELIDINFKGTIFCNKEALKYFTKQNHGNIINISSIYGVYGGSCEAVYSATKAGIIGLTKALAQEYGQIGLRINAIAPGFIDTNMTKEFNEQERVSVIDNTPLARLGNGEDVANTVYFLASDDASFITGETIVVSGGAIKF